MSLRKFSGVLPLVLLSACATHPRLARNLPPAATQPALQRQIRNAADAGEGDYETRQLRARLDADPSNLNARLDLARHYQHQGFPEIAVEHLRLAVERAPESADAAVALAKMLRQTGRPGEGAQVLAAFADKRQPTLDVWAWLGVLRDEAGDWVLGETAHRKAIELAPGRDDLHNNLGWCLLGQGRKAEAAGEFRAALKLNPGSVIARNNLGTSLVDTPNEAVLHLQSVTDPASAHNNIAVALIESGKYDEARHEIDTALSYNRQNTAALNNLQLLSELDGKPAEIRAMERPSGRWPRPVAGWHAAWRRIRALGGPASREKKNSGSNVASR